VAVINYAIKIETGYTGGADSDYAIDASGVVRFITGRPGYTGSPTYPTGEGTITVPTADLEGAWYEGWITKGGVKSATRIGEIHPLGGYGNLSSFSFSIEGASKWLAWAESNGVYVASKPCTLYVVIDDVFYYAWSGVVRDTPKDPPVETFQCVDSFKSAHKQIPPTEVSETNYPNATDDALGQSVPVCIGDVPYAEARNVTGEPDFLTLFSKDGVDYKATVADQYFIDSGFSKVDLYCTPGFDPDVIGAVGNQNYLAVAAGKDSDTDALYKVFSATSAGSSTLNGVPVSIIRVTFFGALPVSPTAFLDYDVDPADATISEDAWWFRIASMTTKVIVSEKAIDGYETNGPRPKITQYDTESGKETDVSYIAYSSDDGQSSGERPSVMLVSSNITKDGDITTEAAITPVVYDVYYADQPNCYDRDRTTEYGTGSIGVTFAVRIPTDVAWADFDEVYLALDLERRTAYSVNSYIQIDISTRSAWGQLVTGLSQTTYFPEQNNYSLTDQYYNWIPNWYYENGGDDNSEDSRWALWEEIGGTYVNNKQHLLLNEDIFNAIKAGDISPVLDVIVTIRPQSTSSATIVLKDVAIIGQRAVTVTDGSVYPRVRGELQSTNQTNTVYRAFVHLLEDYDGISSGDIDYGNLAATRADWHVGRQLVDKKSSFNYLRELCEQAFVAIVPKRNGGRKLTAWREDNDFSGTSHDESSVLRGSIRKMEKTPIAKTYNVFKLKYCWHPGRGEYIRSMTVDRVDESAFPSVGVDSDSDGIDDWKTYVGGVSESSYADAKDLWDTAHASYLRTEAINELPARMCNLSWFTDWETFRPGTASPYLGTGSSAYKALTNCVQWCTRQCDTVEYAIPLTAANVLKEVLAPVTFNDSHITDGADRYGWITKIKINPSKDQIEIEALLQPDDIEGGGVDDVGDIDESGSRTDTIDESGSRTDTYTEGA